MAVAPAALEVAGLSCSFGNLKALDRCSFSVVKGSVMGLVGPNGSGKTTLINCVTGLLEPDAGDVFLDGVKATGWGADRMARGGVGRTFQTSRVFPRLTVAENLSVASYLSGTANALAAADLLELFDLARYRDRFAGTLSYGQLKLVELASVMATDPHLIILDEPAAGVNPLFLQSLQAQIRKLRGSGRTLLIVEHNIPFLFALCDQVVVLEAGAKIAEGPPDQIRSNSRVLEAYLGETGDVT